MRLRPAIGLAIGLFLAGVWVLHAQNPQAPTPSKLEKLKDDLYVILGEGGNTTVLLTNEGVVLGSSVS